MTRKNAKRTMKWSAALMALVLAVAIPVLAMAEAATQTPAASDTTTATAPATDATASATTRGRMGGRGMMDGRGMTGGYGMMDGLNTSALTDEQKAAYDSAISLYDQVEDKVLQDLVTAGVVAQADVDAYAAQRAAEKSLNELDQSQWTADQYKAFYEANAKTGDERKAAMQALADAGQLTQAQADALSAQGESDLWSKVSQNADTNSVIQSALTTMRQACQTLNSSLRAAGIEGMGRMMGGMGRMTDGNCFGQGNDQNQNQNQNQNGTGRMMGGMRGRG